MLCYDSIVGYRWILLFVSLQSMYLMWREIYGLSVWGWAHLIYQPESPLSLFYLTQWPLKGCTSTCQNIGLECRVGAVHSSLAEWAHPYQFSPTHYQLSIQKLLQKMTTDISYSRNNSIRPSSDDDSGYVQLTTETFYDTKHYKIFSKSL